MGVINIYCLRVRQFINLIRCMLSDDVMYLAYGIQSYTCTLMKHIKMNWSHFMHFSVDTKEERNALMQYVYPKLEEYCRDRHGLEFQVIVILLNGIKFELITFLSYTCYLFKFAQLLYLFLGENI